MGNYYLGLDGGGTKTLFTVIDENNNIVYESTCGGSSLDSGIPFDVISVMLAKELEKIPYPISSVFLGCGGMNTKDDHEKVLKFLKGSVINKTCKFYDCGSDVNNALYGALDMHDGIILIAGTGSVAFGKNGNKTFRSGGYCFQEGDAGSAYNLGHKAMEYLARVLDKRLEPSKFSDDLIQATGVDNFEKCVSFFVNVSRSDMAKLAKVVTLNENNKYAREIIINGANETFEMVKAVYKELDFKGETLFSIIGSLGNASTLYKKWLLANLTQLTPNIKYIDMVNSAGFGSAMKAKYNYYNK